jgi:hypothetical protein
MLEAAAVVLAAIAALAPVPAPLVERWYSLELYPRVQHVLTPVSNLLPFAWLDVIVVFAVATVIIALVRSVRRAWRERRVAIVLVTLAHMTAAAAAVYLVFLAVWGLNYRRVPMEQRLVLDRAAPAPDAALNLGLEAVMHLNTLYEEAHEEGWIADARDNLALRQAFVDVQRSLSDGPLAVPGRLKRSALGPYFRWSSIDGMVNPFGLEVLANPDLLAFERPFVAAHEWSHLAGFADEAEANFVGWLACIRADVPTQYSGWLYLFWQVNGEVNGRDRQQLAAALAPGPKQDIQAVTDRLRRAQLPLLRNVSWLVYDQYLKANRVDEGVRSYGAVITLLLRARFRDGWTPVRRTDSTTAPPQSQPGS